MNRPADRGPERGRRRNRRALTLVALMVLSPAGAAACGRQGDPSDLPPAGPSGSIGPRSPAAGTGDGLELATRVSLRDGDVTDVDELMAAMTTGTAGDPTWIEVFARLRALSWLATRYPGRYDLSDIYRDEAADTARANEAESLALGVYLDEPLPVLLSVTSTRTVGEVVELEVILDAGPATVRGDDDDLPRAVLPGGTHRGLFMVGRDGPDDRWRIHSVVELHLVDRTTGQEPDR